MVGHYKYDIINTEKITEAQDTNFPQYLLGSSLKEAEETLEEFNTYINNLASTYSKSTNIDKSEFFGDAIIALGKAKHDFDPERSNAFVPFAKFIIIDSMNECIRKNKAIVRCPTYIDKAHKIIVRIKTSLTIYTNTIEDVLFGKHFNRYKIPKSIKKTILRDKKLLENAAKRLEISVESLFYKAEYLPLVIPTDDYIDRLQDFNIDESSIIAKLVVNEIKLLLDKNELIVANLIMEDKKRSEISKLLGHSDSWVTSRIEAIRYKVEQMIVNKRGKNENTGGSSQI